jgi:hypothetical protein
MKFADEMAIDLLKRLLTGERELVPLNLAMLLEKSARLDRGDDPRDVEDHYRSLVLPEIENLRISRQTREGIIAQLCAEILRNPDDATISVSVATGDESAVRAIVKILAGPPRELTLCERAMALSHVTKYLPHYLRKDPEFLPKSELERLARLVRELYDVKAGESSEDKSSQATIAHFAPQLLASLERIGIVGS